VYTQRDFFFLTDTIKLVMESHLALSYTYAFRYYLKGENKQSYFDCIVEDLTFALEVLDPSTPEPKQNMASSFFQGLNRVMSMFSKEKAE